MNLVLWILIHILLSVMAKLLTHHDPFHVHAILGALILFHFLARIALVVTIGDAFPFRNKTLVLDVVLVLLHAALPLTSLLLPLPAKRNYNSPMIWPEFRLHSLIFASRHVLSTVLWLVMMSGKETQVNGAVSMTLKNFLASLLFIHATMFAATGATTAVGDEKQRTTNAMPYSPCVSLAEQARAKKIYAFAQFQAAAFLLAGSPTMAFIPLTGIQSAPFLMTLVRKGKCTTPTYHCIYMWSLLLPLFALRRCIVAGTLSVQDGNLAVVTGSLAYLLRTSLRLPKHLVWLLAPTVTILLFQALPASVTSLALLASASVVVSLGLPNFRIPNILLNPNKAMEPFVKNYGEIAVGSLYAVASLGYIVTAELKKR